MLRSRAPDTAPRRNPGVLHNVFASCRTAIRNAGIHVWRTAREPAGSSKAVRPTGTLSAEGCSHHRTGRSVERLLHKNNGARLSGPCFLLFHINADPGGLGERLAMPHRFPDTRESRFILFRPHLRACVRSRAGTRLRSFALPRRVEVSWHTLPNTLQLSSRTRCSTK